MHKKSSYRSERVGDQIKRELAQLIQFKITDPRLSGITIIEVQMSKDLSTAKIYFSVLHENDIAQALIALKKAQIFLRKQIATLMKLRTVPQLNFIYDESVIKAQYLTQLIDTALENDTQAAINSESDIDTALADDTQAAINSESDIDAALADDTQAAVNSESDIDAALADDTQAAINSESDIDAVFAGDAQATINSEPSQEPR